MHSSQPKPSPHNRLAFTAVKIMGSKMGKAKIAVKVELLFVFAAMAETKVKIPEMPKLPKTNTPMKSELFSKGLLSKRVKNNQLIKAISKTKAALKSSLARIMACGLERV